FAELVDLVDPSGERRCYELKVDVLRGARGERIGAFQLSHDVTARILERERRLIEGALQSADRAKTLVQRLLAFARRQPLQPTAVDLGALVRGMADLV